MSLVLKGEASENFYKFVFINNMLRLFERIVPAKHSNVKLLSLYTSCITQKEPGGPSDRGK